MGNSCRRYPCPLPTTEMESLIYHIFAKQHGRLSRDSLRLFYLTYFWCESDPVSVDTPLPEFVSDPITCLYRWSRHTQNEQQLEKLVQNIERFGRAKR